MRGMGVKIKAKENKALEDDGENVGRRSVRKGGELLLFSLYGVSWSHVVTGDVTFLSGVDGASLPPVAFPEDRRKVEITHQQYGHKNMSGRCTYTDRLEQVTSEQENKVIQSSQYQPCGQHLSSISTVPSC